MRTYRFCFTGLDKASRLVVGIADHTFGVQQRKGIQRRREVPVSDVIQDRFEDRCSVVLVGICWLGRRSEDFATMKKEGSSALRLHEHIDHYHDSPDKASFQELLCWHPSTF